MEGYYISGLWSHCRGLGREKIACTHKSSTLSLNSMLVCYSRITVSNQSSKSDNLILILNSRHNQQLLIIRGI